MFLRFTFFFFFSLLLTIAQAQINFSGEESQHELLLQLDEKIKKGDYEDITSVLVTHKGQLVFERYYNDNDSNSVHNTRSATKTIATFLTGIAIDKGHIKSENEPIMKYLKEFEPLQNPDERKNKITIEDMLTMSSCLECDDNNSSSRGHEERMYIIENWSKFYLDLPIKSYPWGPKPKDAPYGRVWSYCSSGAALLAQIVQNAVGMTAIEFAEKHLLKPLGMKGYILHKSPTGVLNTAGGSEYRSRDLLRLGQLCINKGQWNGEQLISSEWIAKATSPKANAWEDMDYGYLMWLTSFGKDKKYPSFFMAGNGGNKIGGIPELELTIVITATNYGQRNMHQYTNEIVGDFIVPAFE